MFCLWYVNWHDLVLNFSQFRRCCFQLTFAPVFNAIILVNLRLLEGLGLETSWRKMKEDWWTIYSSSLKVIFSMKYPYFHYLLSWYILGFEIFFSGLASSTINKLLLDPIEYASDNCATCCVLLECIFIIQDANGFGGRNHVLILYLCLFFYE